VFHLPPCFILAHALFFGSLIAVFFVLPFSFFSLVVVLFDREGFPIGRTPLFLFFSPFFGNFFLLFIYFQGNIVSALSFYVTESTFG